MSSIEDERITPRRVMDARKCWGFAGVCVAMLLLSGSIMGLAMMASGQTFSDLVDENAVNWKIKDVSTHTNTGAVQVWDYETPLRTDAGLEIPFKNADDDWFTVYIVNIWEGDLTGMKVKAEFMITGDTSSLPVFVARAPDSEVQVKLHFTKTGGSWAASDLWWSLDQYVLTTYTKLSDGTAVDPVTDTTILNKWLILEVELTPDMWSNLDGKVGSAVLDEFNAAIADIHEIGFSFGRSARLASGVALTQGDSTFVLKSFELLPVPPET